MWNGGRFASPYPFKPAVSFASPLLVDLSRHELGTITVAQPHLAGALFALDRIFRLCAKRDSRIRKQVFGIDLAH